MKSSAVAAGRNILFSSSFGDMRGGGQQSLLLLLKGLDRSKFTPHLICPAHGGFVEEARSDGITTTVVPVPPLRSFSLMMVWRLIGYIREKNIDLVHTDSPRWTVYLGLAAKAVGKPLVWHVRVGNPDPALYEAFLFALCARVIAVSQAVAKRFVRFQDAEKVAVIHNSVDLNSFSPELAGAEDVMRRGAPGRLAIGTFGRLVREKGQETLLEAAALAASELPQEPLYFVVGKGEESYENRLQLRARELDLGESVFFLGFRSDIARIMAALDIVILYSTFVEGFSRVIIEAMATGKPVITTDLGGNPEAVIHGYNGLLVEPDGDPAKLAQAIVELAQDAEGRSRMGRNSRLRVEDLFDIERNIAGIESVYSELLLH